MGAAIVECLAFGAVAVGSPGGAPPAAVSDRQGGASIVEVDDDLAVGRPGQAVSQRALFRAIAVRILIGIPVEPCGLREGDRSVDVSPRLNVRQRETAGFAAVRKNCDFAR